MTNPYFTNTFQRAFGTFPLQGNELRMSLQTALEVGYRAIDTAQMYGNEAEVGKTLAASNIKRSDLLITTKVSNDRFSETEFIPSVERSLKDLQLDIIDVLLLHWPPADGNISPSLKLLLQAKEQGLARHVGISNYTIAMLQRVRELTDVEIVTNQVEFHPLLNQEKLLAAANQMNIPLSSYCSVARGKVFEHPLFEQIGQAKNVSAGQVVLRWIYQKGVSVNTMSTNPENIRRNFDIVSFELTDQEMLRIDALNSTGMRVVTKAKIPWAPDWD